tara:strand:- start:5536 stop:6000 length:465 start_codon:yes stop_codon:yes gene_type:complete
MNGDKSIERIMRDLYFLYLFAFNQKIPLKPSTRGDFGEWIALKMLKKKGFKCIHRNWRSCSDRRMEIDLICVDRQSLVFVEVRSRSVDTMVSGWQSLMTKKKLKSLRRACMLYLFESKKDFNNHRLDVVEVDIPTKMNKKIDSFHHENIAILKT